MGRNSGFTFKQFHVAHDRCAMKVGTDGILLGAWAPVTNARRILDIGSGSGLIALMLAQRSPAGCRIDAVELDSNAARQARENAAASPWHERVSVIESAIQTYQAAPYDLIVSNPPTSWRASHFAIRPGHWHVIPAASTAGICWPPVTDYWPPTARLRWSCQRPWPMKFYASRRIMICTPFVIQLLSPEREKRQIVFYCDLAED
ncbi:tRNA (adenine-N6)-methyltransferase [Aeromonas hydrophila]|nr:tRNA (adenine-N6)-methyltransferase [Aeromonas hydrophila]